MKIIKIELSRTTTTFTYNSSFDLVMTFLLRLNFDLDEKVFLL